MPIANGSNIDALAFLIQVPLQGRCISLRGKLITFFHFSYKSISHLDSSREIQI
jgi:hypothetical protein